MCIGDAVTMREGAPAEVLRKVDALWGDACGAEVTSPTTTAGAARRGGSPTAAVRVFSDGLTLPDAAPTPETERDATDPVAHLPGWLRPFAERLEFVLTSNSPTAQSPVDDEDNESPFSCFESVTPPDVSIAEYVMRLWLYFTDLKTWAMTMVYLDRFEQKTALHITPYTAHRVVLSALAIAAHKASPASISVSAVAFPGGVEVDDLSTMVRTFAQAIDFNFSCGTEDLAASLLASAAVPTEELKFSAMLLAVGERRSSAESGCAAPTVASNAATRRISANTAYDTPADLTVAPSVPSWLTTLPNTFNLLQAPIPDDNLISSPPSSPPNPPLSPIMKPSSPPADFNRSPVQLLVKTQYRRFKEVISNKLHHTRAHRTSVAC
ncbi:hypothetical protein DIPPA_10496 [Diplonema papillatum]|nr:hypothetical protein DIPPA_10496 [Diplonema papillatum]